MVAPKLPAPWIFILSLLAIYVAGLLWFPKQIISMTRDYLEIYKN
jgi:hypothetical protein